MKIGIIHLTYIHYEVTTNINDKIESLSNSIRTSFLNIEYLYFVISGDLVFSEKKEEYLKFQNIVDKIITDNKDRKIKVIFCPGNHDCDYSKNSQLRSNTIKLINYETIGSDDSVFNICLKIQDEFWEFYKKYNEKPENKIYYIIKEKIENYEIKFHCLNTAWMADIDQKPGEIFYPVNLISNKDKSSTINISVYHHPSNWITPETEPNNKREFDKFVSTISSIQLIGHEHEESFKQEMDCDLNSLSYNFSGEIFYDKKIKIFLDIKH